MYLRRSQSRAEAAKLVARGDVQVLHVLKTVAQVAQERVVQVLQHTPLSNDIPYTLRPNHLILPDVLERERQACVFSLHYADLAKRALAHHAQQTEVIEVDLVGEDYGLAIGVAHLYWTANRSSVGGGC